MINIDRRNPWILWTNSICPNFLNKSAGDLIKGDQYYKITMDFSYTEGHKKDLFAIVPNYTGFSIVDNRIFLGIGYQDKDDWFDTEYEIKPNTKINLVVEHKPSNTLTIIVDNFEVYKADLSSRPLAIMNDPQMFIGAGKWTGSKEPNSMDFCLSYLKIEDELEVYAEHNFDKIIHSKSVDTTGNNNFIYRLR
tara:strand:+ start:5502 stop:6080 length:579 start_codon:yes stop_codon:yes gene_type:complete